MDDNEKFSEAKLRRLNVLGIKKEYTPFLTSIQACDKQSTVEELETLLFNQKALTKQMSTLSVPEIDASPEPDAAIFSKGKSSSRTWSTRNKNLHKFSNSSSNIRSENSFKSDRCGRPDHIKRNYVSKLSNANIAFMTMTT